jgi:CheY-like chemotaxis protein
MTKVVVSDDHPHARRVLKLRLEQAGYDVHLASDGRAALELIRTIQPQAVVTDLKMPDMSGEELCCALHADGLLPTLHVLVVTSSADRALRARLTTYPGVGVVEKPFSPNEVCAWLQARLSPGVSA